MSIAVERKETISFIAKAFPVLGSKTAVKKAIADGRLTRNGKAMTFGDSLRKNDVLKLQAKEGPKFKKIEVALDIVYEDDFLMAVHKPGGIAVNGSRNKTVENAVRDHNRSNQQADALPRPIAVHRIDLPTKGLVLVAKTKTAQIKLGKAFQNNTIQKAYFAVVHGETPEKAALISPSMAKKRSPNLNVFK